jgi:hypothetical protein
MAFAWTAQTPVTVGNRRHCYSLNRDHAVGKFWLQQLATVCNGATKPCQARVRKGDPTRAEPANGCSGYTQLTLAARKPLTRPKSFSLTDSPGARRIARRGSHLPSPLHVARNSKSIAERCVKIILAGWFRPFRPYAGSESQFESRFSKTVVLAQPITTG